MTAIAKGIRFSTYNTRSLVVSFLVLSLVVALFFIPEIIGLGFQSTLSRDTVASRAPAVKATPAPKKPAPAPVAAQPKPAPKAAEPEQQSTFDRMMSLLSFSRDEGPIKAGKPRGEDAPVTVKSAAGLKGKEPEIVETGDTGISWATLKSRPTQKALLRAQNSAQTLAHQIERKFEATRFALFDFVSGIRTITKSPPKAMSSDEAVQYLERLDGAVTNSMKREAVPATYYNQWADISLGPLFEKSRAYRAKMAGRMAFDPQLQLLSVTVFQPPDRFGKFIENGKAYAKFRASVVGSDVKRVVLYHNGNELLGKSPRKEKHGGRRVFHVNNLNARGLYTFRVYDVRGNFVDKSYVFYQPARRFPWVRKAKGRFAIPYGEHDARLDRLFTYRSYRTSAKPRAVVYFRENEISDKNRF